MFARANYRSPGFTPGYVMGWQKKRGLMRRTYTNQELRVLDKLGYTFVPTYALNNRPPRILTPIISPSPTVLGLNAHLTQTPPANNSDLYITTTSCRQVKIDLNANGTGSITDWDPATSTAISSHSLGLSDPDGDPISVFDNGAGTPHGIWIIEGCAPDAGNPSPVRLNAGRDVITFQSRNNFVGRTRFAFHVFDGTERGSMLVITIDVTKDASCYNNVCDLVVNGNFEAGSDYNTYNSPGGYNMVTIADNVNFWDHYMEFGGMPNQVLTDGVEQLYPGANPNFGVTSIVDTYMPEHCFGPEASYYTITPPGLHFTPNSYPVPTTASSPNKRYLLTEYTGIHNEQNLTLHDDIIPGGRYKVDFDYYMLSFVPPYTSMTPSPPFSGEPLSLFFNGTHYLGNITYPTTVPEYIAAGSFPWSGTGWQHFSTSFTYPSAAGASNNYMRVIYDYPTSPLCTYMLMDNVSLTRDVCAVVSASSTTIPSVLTATVPGGGVTYQWYFNGVLIPGATSGTYTANVYGTYSVTTADANGCTSSNCQFASKTLVDPCPAFTFSVGASNIVGTIDGSSGPLTTPPIATKAYYVKGVVTVPSSMIFLANNFLMAPNAKIYVDNGALLTINSSHLATCPGSGDMWQGIELANHWGRIAVIGSSLIEDADKAIYAHNMFDGALNMIVLTDDAVFNRNRYGLFIDNDPANAAQYRSVNTIFTSRYLYPNNSFNSWPSPATLKVLSGPVTAPYALNGYSIADCKDGNIGYTGIYLNNIGARTGSGLYNDLTVGDENSPLYRNLFDYTRVGIESHDANLAVRHSSFMNMRSGNIPGTTSGGSVGVYADASGPTPRHLSVETINGNTLGLRNEFWDNQTGVECYDHYDVAVNRGYFTSTNLNVAAAAPWKGYNGILIRSNSYKTITTDYNNLEHMLYGIVVFSTMNPASGAWPVQILARYNNINANIAPPGLALSNQNQGILIESQFTNRSYLGYPAPPWVVVNGNTLNGVYNGISVSNFWYHQTLVQENTVNMQRADNKLTQYGIFESNDANDQIVSNPVGNTAAVPATANSNDNQRAVYTSSCSGDVVDCNSASNTGRGFEFASSHVFTNWLHNTMTNNQKGFVLNSAAIGKQPNVITTAGDACNNYWSGSTWGGANYHTYTINSLPANSRLYVVNATGYVPTWNRSLPVPSPWFYVPFTTGLTVATTNFNACVPTWRLPIVGPQPRIHHEDIAQNRITYGCNEGRACWMAQMQLYRLAAGRDSLCDTSAIVQAFLTTAATSRFAWLTAIEDSLAAGNNAAVAALLGAPPPPAAGLTGPSCVVVADSAVANHIVANYVSYYQLSLAWNTGSFNSTDSLALVALANLCPLRDGAVIYQARTLLKIITKDYPVYNDNCGDIEVDGGEARRALVENGPQQYTLSPNPNNGIMQLRQLVAIKEPVSIKVYNAVGASVYSGDVLFTGRAATLSLSNLAPGVYHVMLRERAGAVYTLKFVKK